MVEKSGRVTPARYGVYPPTSTGRRCRHAALPRHQPALLQSYSRVPPTSSHRMLPLPVLPPAGRAALCPLCRRWWCRGSPAWRGTPAPPPPRVPGRAAWAAPAAPRVASSACGQHEDKETHIMRTARQGWRGEPCYDRRGRCIAARTYQLWQLAPAQGKQRVWGPGHAPDVLLLCCVKHVWCDLLGVVGT